MKGHDDVIQALNQVVQNAHASYMQFLKHGLYLKDRGYAKLAEFEAKQAHEEKSYVKDVSYRILFLEGDPNLHDLGEADLSLQTDIRRILETDLKQHQQTLNALRHAVKTANDVLDYGSRDLVNTILKEKEEQVDVLEAELHKVEDMGLQVYLSTKE
jgi:bacterioferritin